MTKLGTENVAWPREAGLVERALVFFWEDLCMLQAVTAAKSHRAALAIEPNNM